MKAAPRRHPQWLMLCPTCNIGQRGACDCPLPAEAASDFGFEHEPAPSVISQRFRSRAAGWLAALALVALYGLAGDPPTDILAELYLPGDGFPTELLAIADEPAAASSEVQP